MTGGGLRERPREVPALVTPMPVRRVRGRARWAELSTGVGLLVAVAGVALGFHMEGAGLRMLLQPTALLVVGAGTAGAVLVQYPMRVVVGAMRALWVALAGEADDSGAMADELVRYARQARRQGLLSLDGELEGVADPFLRRGLTLAVDGVPAEELRSILEREVVAGAERADLDADVLETAGGSAPTIGILGAVLGLIHVMRLLGDVDEVGRGIAAAFVSTVYGVGVANLVLLPLAGKLRMRAQAEELTRAMILEGVVSIAGGVMPRALEVRLGGYVTARAAPVGVKARAG